MTENSRLQRSPIPAELYRRVLVEAGHRCAIPTCRETQIDIHHIIPWEKCKEHAFENLIALCPNCHRRAHSGEIDKKSLRLYKEVREIVKSEMTRVSLQSLGRMAQIDRKLIDFWERERFLSPEEGGERLALFEKELDDLETKLLTAPIEDRYQIASLLRELYREYLRYAREYWASSQGYQLIRNRVMEGLTRIEALEGPKI